MHSLARLILVSAQILMLCSCALIPHTKGSAGFHTTANSSAATEDDQSSQGQDSPGNASGADTAFNRTQEITPAQSIQKGGLLVSYSMLTVPGRNGNLVRLSLVFRNLQNQGKVIRPQVLLWDSRGKRIRHYTKNSFLHASAHMAANTPGDASNSLININGNDKKAARARTEWANSYWLKYRYRIPAHGIAIGELVYLIPHIYLPLNLSVKLGRQKFDFNTRGDIPVASKR